MRRRAFSTMSEGLLLDTCTAIWWTAGEPLDTRARSRIERAARSKRVYVSPITAWEVGNLAVRGRSPIKIAAIEWYNRMLELDGFVEASVDAETLTASCELVGLGDPADRILAAAARIHYLLFVTRDGKILEYGAAGHLRVMEC